MNHSRTESARMAGPAFAPVRLVEPGGVRSLPAGPVLDALGKIRDLIAGAGLLVQMIERDEIERETEDGMPLFSATDRGTLIRLAASAACAAAGIADDLGEWAADHHKTPRPAAPIAA
ncbi:hypothetical protein [Sphaerotilus uruguayifluvii]|uniref:Uncharacterized protein n=1 Tax=Sphaerotilus uruguayifluvii TaxID=2735897 RepID=A0ABX2G175_9BURK|nr:hypothetical protein [Leptothrix sp. C29]NRT55193.1 hypothetical protein [Leptothrix sp. C29]